MVYLILNLFLYLGIPLLIYATSTGCLKIVKFLLKKGCGINCQDNTGRTPLHWAVLRDNMDIVKYLVEKGACLTIKDNEGATPIHCSLKGQTTKCIKYLLHQFFKCDRIEEEKFLGMCSFVAYLLHLCTGMGKLDVGGCGCNALIVGVVLKN